MTEHDAPAGPKSCGLPPQTAKDPESGEWVTVASFFPPPSPEPDFDTVVANEAARWEDTAREAGLRPEEHVRVERNGEEVAVVVSARLDAIFTPEQTLWRAI